MNPELNKNEICKLLPHSGEMCLIDSILSWDQENLIAQTMSHQNKKNPLLYKNKITSIMGIEYAAQTMAIHFSLIHKYADKQKQGENKQGGYLATARNIQILEENLFDFQHPQLQALFISVIILMKDSQGYTYNFEISSNNTMLICGKLTIFLGQDFGSK